MTRESFLILLGILVVLSPFAGLPLSILSWILPVLGLLIVLIGVLYRRDRIPKQSSAEVKNSELS